MSAGPGMSDVTAASDYSTPGWMKQFGDFDFVVLDGITADAVDRLASRCTPGGAAGRGQNARAGGRAVHGEPASAGEGVARCAAGTGSSPLNVPRALQRRGVGTCRHFAVLSRAPLQLACPRPLRVATHFQPERATIALIVIEDSSRGDKTSHPLDISSI